MSKLGERVEMVRRASVNRHRVGGSGVDTERCCEPLLLHSGPRSSCTLEILLACVPAVSARRNERWYVEVHRRVDFLDDRADGRVVTMLEPERLWSASDVLASPSAVPAEPGLYGWWFRSIPGSVDVTGCVNRHGCTLLRRDLAQGPASERSPCEPPESAVSRPVPLQGQRGREAPCA
jgi:hypothetical protein